MERIDVMIVDDSAVIRQVFRQILESDPQIEVTAACPDPVFAMKRLATRWPDVIVLDVEMPHMDGLSFLKKIMAERPTPVVMCSTLTERGAETTMQALAAGAVEAIAKPKSDPRSHFQEDAAQLIRAVKSAARVRTDRLQSPRRPARPVAARTAPMTNGGGIVAIGTSTGGTRALEDVLTELPPGCPGLVIVQHMPEKFTAAFATRLDGLCRIEVKEAAAGDRVLPGRALIAPGGRHMLLVRSGGEFRVDIKDGPPVNRHRPSVDVLFRSVARNAGANALGIIMTGMGDDGAAGIVAMRNEGAHTIAQDEASCVVFGMPKEAIRRGGADEILSLDAIPQAIVRYGEGGKHGSHRVGERPADAAPVAGR